MANPERKLQDQDDHIGHNESISDETLASRKTKRDGQSMGMTSIDLLDKNHRDNYSRADRENSNGSNQNDISCVVSSQKRFNKSFHNYRLLVVMMGGMSVGLMLALRYNISVAIIRMVNQTHMYLEEHPDRSVDDFLEEGYSLGGEFIWNNKVSANFDSNARQTGMGSAEYTVAYLTQSFTIR